MGYITMLKKEATILFRPVKNYAKLFICQTVYDLKLYNEKCVLFLRLTTKQSIRIQVVNKALHLQPNQPNSK